ncbi:GGDEF domain-containing protein [Chitinimonas viridis]|uniref:diguanylate cyclase n=1 Tax=Chitinimonas viridis TaxID=664880 RepID=A0ABT8B606_9NEIS|nr:GGDEF domain-containing protein [Chitinimonas viridis]MDN3577657.1 GGDEF domain-containing protein [Chitinimonas viridis]
MLDARTLAIALVVTTLLSALMLQLASYGRMHLPGGRHWVVGLLLLAVTWGLMALRGVVPDVLSVLLANLLIFTAAVLLYAAMAEVVGLPPYPANLRWTAIIGGGGLSLAFFGGAIPMLMIFIVSLALTLLLVMSVRMLLRGATRMEAPARYAMGLWLGLCALILLVRTIGALVHPPASMQMTGPLHTLSMLAAQVIVLGCSLGFALMARETMVMELAQRATHDALTGAFNRYAFDPVGQAALTRLAREPGELSVLMLDIDHFKQINDDIGHLAGDEVLCEVARRIESLLRGGDMLARYGGEEFCILLPATGPAEALQVAERLRLAIASELFMLKGCSIKVTASIGVATVAEAMELKQLIGLADSALYGAKLAGRNRSCGPGLC